LPLMQALDNLKLGLSIPPKTVVLTFDDAYRSIYTEAFPLLKEKGWPFTVFVTTKYISDSYSQFMNWAQLREIEKYGGEIGNHSHTHAYFIRKKIGENDSQWRLRIMSEINQAQTILTQQLEQPITAIAYPYGEFSDELKQVLMEFDYYGLGQQSGAVSTASDFQAIPRFPMAVGFDGLADFAIKVKTNNLPVTILAPRDGIISEDNKMPELRLRLEKGGYRAGSLACYATGQGRIKVDWIEQEDNVVTVRAIQPLNPGRTRYNCTASSKSEKGVYYWFSFLWMKPLIGGNWYDE
jgi:biofilm PGA synthesis lipoprotein PgaB